MLCFMFLFFCCCFCFLEGAVSQNIGEQKECITGSIKYRSKTQLCLTGREEEEEWGGGKRGRGE